MEALIHLDEIINMYLEQYQLPQSKYGRISRLAIRGLRLFYRDSLGAPKEVELTVQANNTAVLPTDCLNKISVSVLNAKGEKASLTEDNLLGLVNVESPSRLSQPTDTLALESQESYIENSLAGNMGVYPMGFPQLGTGSTGTIGLYRIDWNTRTIVFDFGFNQPTVILEYLSVPNEDGEYKVHNFFQEALIAYIAWQDAVGNPKIAASQRELNKRDFDTQYHNARKAMTPFNPSDVYNQYRQGVRLAPKA